MFSWTKRLVRQVGQRILDTVLWPSPVTAHWVACQQNLCQTWEWTFSAPWDKMVLKCPPQNHGQIYEQKGALPTENWHLPSTSTKIKSGQGTTDWFPIGKGVHQGCTLSPCLFTLYAEYIMRNAGLDEAQAGIKIARRNINNLRYADDTTLMAESEEELQLPPQLLIFNSPERSSGWKSGMRHFMLWEKLAEQAFG